MNNPTVVARGVMVAPEIGLPFIGLHALPIDDCRLPIAAHLLAVLKLREFIGSPPRKLMQTIDPLY
jgi:hypothetical protein